MRSIIHTAFAALSISAFGFAASASEGYYKTPSLRGETVVISSEGDLWRVGANGGAAARLTTHVEVESHPHLSPSGNQIAFIGRYDGPAEIYTMPTSGGVPVRVTFEGGGVYLRGWQDENTLLYRSTNIPGTTPRLMRKLSLATGAITDIPMADADEGVFAPGGDFIFTRYGLSIFSDNAVQYRGGRMAQLWKAALSSGAEATRLAKDFGAPIRHPMVSGERIYFVSDKSGADNIWSLDMAGGTPRQHTQRSQWQIKAPLMDGSRIIFQSGADIYIYNTNTSATSQLNITLPSDSDHRRKRWIDEPLKFLDDARISPKGDSIAVTARGHITAGFKGERRRISLTTPDGRRARSAAHGHDGKWIYAVIDGEGKSDIWRFAADGSGRPEKMTAGHGSHIWALMPSPHDGSLLYWDKKGTLWRMDTDTRSQRQIDKTQSGNDWAFDDITWSAGGRYISYAFYDARDMARVAVYDTQTSQRHEVTTGKYESYGPTFSPDGEWLYFISNRNFSAFPSSPWGDRNMGPAFKYRGEIYALQLDPEARFPFHPKNELDLAADDSETETEDENEDDKSETDNSEADITFNGLKDRLWKVPVKSGSYGRLAATDSHIYVRAFGDSPSLEHIKITDKDAEIKSFKGNVQRFGLSADRETLFVQTGRGSKAGFYLVDAGGSFPDDAGDDKVSMSGWKLPVNPSEEWVNMLSDAWQLHRDFAYDPNLRGVNWQAVGDHYIPMAKRIGHRSEVNDLLAQMSAELGILHSQIRPGELPRDKESGSTAFLGAELSPASGGLRISKLYTGEKNRPTTLGPLLQPGQDFKNGDVITFIDNVSVRTLADITEQLTSKSGQQILIDYSRNGVSKQAITQPVGRWANGRLRYAHWVQSRREAVTSTSGGDIGYLHIRAMGGNDIASFARDFYEHHDKDGLVIDVRGNRGGNIDSWIIGTLLRQSWAYWKSPHGGPATTNMQQAFRGHLAILVNEGTYSDGETFAAGIKALDLAPLIGTRTAGAGIWLSDRNPLRDGGQARVAEYPQYGMDGRWMLEGRGVSPDIEVVNPPRATYEGRDAQLERAVSYLQNKIAVEPIPELNPQPLPPLGTTGRDVD